jgi:rhodanese-related sulfurtransferase
LSIFSFLGLGNGRLKEVLRKGAVIVDVRTAHEFDSGRVPASINIPVDKIGANVGRIKQLKKPVVLCCESGSRSAIAARILKENGIKEVYNGGSWLHVLKLVKSL